MTSVIQPSGFSFEIGPLSQKVWDNLVVRFQDASLYQTWAYGTVRWGEKSVEHVVVRKTGELVAAAQVIVKKLMPFIGVAYVPWGPMWKPFDKEMDYKHFKHIIEILKQHYTLKLGLLLRVAPNALSDDQKASAILRGAGFESNPSAAPYRTIILDLSPSLEKTREGLKQKWRNCLNQSQRNPLVLKFSTSDDCYRQFLRMQQEMQERKRFMPGVDYNQFALVQQKLENNMKMSIFLSITNSEPNASLVLSNIGNSGIYLLGASNLEGRRLRSAYFLQWKALEYLKQQGIRYYDLGGINPKINPGVYDFKTGLGGKEVSHIGSFETSRNFISKVVVSLAEKVLKSQRKFSLRQSS